MPEDKNENPSNLLKELLKVNQKNKQKKVEPVRQGRALEQSEPVTSVTNTVDELPFAEVQPLPFVARSRTKAKVDVAKDGVEELLDIPKLTVEPGFKNKAPLQADERAKDLLQEALKNPICITTEDLLNISEPMRQELKKLLIKKCLEKKSVVLTAEVESGKDPVAQKQIVMDAISVDKFPEVTYEVLAEDTNGMAKGLVIVNDPVMQYLNALAPGEKPKSVIVAAESHALRTVYPLINRAGEAESLLDPGSQIISMSREVSVMLGV